MTGKPIRSECFHSVLGPYRGRASHINRRSRYGRYEEQTSGMPEHDTRQVEGRGTFIFWIHSFWLVDRRTDCSFSFFDYLCFSAIMCVRSPDNISQFLFRTYQRAFRRGGIALQDNAFADDDCPRHCEFSCSYHEQLLIRQVLGYWAAVNSIGHNNCPPS